MKALNIPRVVIAGTSSGVGKTTIVTGLLGALKQRGFSVQSYKVGPDYIDPGYHSLASGKPAHNLDTWLIPPEKLVAIFGKTTADNEIAIIEGVMGLYDGGRNGVSSTASIAKLFKAPVILVVDAKSMGESAAALALGFKQYDAEVNIAGVILNRLGSETHQEIICSALGKIGVEVIGCVYRNNTFTLQERHLGLTPTTENDAEIAVKEMTARISDQVNINRILEIAKTSKPITLSQSTQVCSDTKVRIGVAHDAAFSFYYPESLDVLISMGAQIIPFSPLSDRCLPDVDGLIIGGGFPEMFVSELAMNTDMRNAVLQAFKSGMPIYAECGGLMYMTRQIKDFNGNMYEMVGAIPATCSMETKLQTVGYVEAAALRSNILVDSGETMRGHEFHFSRMIADDERDFAWAFQIKKMRTGAVYNAGYSNHNLLASYLHMHFAGSEAAAKKFVLSCQKYRDIDR